MPADERTHFFSAVSGCASALAAGRRYLLQLQRKTNMYHVRLGLAGDSKRP